MNKQEILKWEMVGQVVWLAAFAVAAVMLVMQSFMATSMPAAIPVTGAEVQMQAEYVVQPYSPSSLCLDDVQAGVVLKGINSTY